MYNTRDRYDNDMRAYPALPRSLQIQKQYNMQRIPKRNTFDINRGYEYRDVNHYNQNMHDTYVGPSIPDVPDFPDIPGEQYDKYKDDKLGEGSFGCVIRGPFILSTDEKNNRFYKTSENRMGEVFKLLINGTSFKKEIRNTLIANKIDNGESSIIIEGYSILNHQDIERLMYSRDSDIRKIRAKIKNCRNIETFIKRNIPYIYQIIYSRVGINLLNLHEYHSRSRFHIKKVLGLCFNLVKGVSKYVNHSFVHFDIKPDNIIYIPNDKLVFIDFGISGFINEIDIKIFDYLKDIYLLPEIVAYNIKKKYINVSKQEELFLHFKRDYEYNLNHMYNHFKDLVVLYLYGDNITLYNHELRRIFNKVMSLNTQAEADAMIRQSLIYYDAYKLCFTIMELIEQYNFRDQMHIGIINDFYKNVLMPVAYIHPSRRIHIHTVLKQYRRFMRTLSYHQA